jgi:hypothetical protein
VHGLDGIFLSLRKEHIVTIRSKFEGKYSELTGKILGAFFQVHNDLGYGFSEKVY